MSAGRHGQLRLHSEAAMHDLCENCQTSKDQIDKRQAQGMLGTEQQDAAVTEV